MITKKQERKKSEKGCEEKGIKERIRGFHQGMHPSKQRQWREAIMRRDRERKGKRVSPWLGEKRKENKNRKKKREAIWEVASGKATWHGISG